MKLCIYQALLHLWDGPRAGCKAVMRRDSFVDFGAI